MNYNYYFNQLPGQEQWRNNLIYTSLISDDKKVFVQWYFNDPNYHKGQNQVVLPELMEEKWNREIKYAQLMSDTFSNLVPEIIDIDHKNRKLYLAIDGNDFWQRTFDINGSYNDVLPDWDIQMLEIFAAHKNLGLYKYSLHPSSYFIVDGQLKSINYFFTYHTDENPFSLKDVESHIYVTRQDILKKIIADMGYGWDTPLPFEKIQRLALESFRINYPQEFIDKAIDLLNV